MVRDVHLRLLFIPLLGIFLPLVSGIVSIEQYNSLQTIIYNLYFIATSFIIWTGCNWIHATLRKISTPSRAFLRRIIIVCFACSLYGSCIGCLSVFGWMRFSSELFDWNKVISFILACMVSVLVFTLIYEIIFLNKEREIDSKIVDKLDKERSQATLQALQNEMDPHFIFNALNTLNLLILNHPQQAHLYNNKLAQVYKYFLVNKHKELVPLDNELEFINNYYYLLQLRYDHKLQLEIRLEAAYPESIQLPPCSLQILLENAIKHNSFSEEEPLLVVITVKDEFIHVCNKMKPKPYLIDSTQIGLNNLSSRYKILFDKDIVINPGKESFIVKLPIIQ